MRRSRVLALAMSAALLLAMASALSAQAAAPSAAYIVYRTDCGGDFSRAREWVSDGVLHIRGAVLHHVNYFLEGGTWVERGTNVTTANINTKLDGSGGAAWGTFKVRGSLVGDYDGHWTWGMSANGNAAAQGVGNDAGKHLKGELPGAAPPDLPTPPPPGCDGFGYELWSWH